MTGFCIRVPEFKTTVGENPAIHSASFAVVQMDCTGMSVRSSTSPTSFWTKGSP
jgi:hypothetical protein